MPSHTEDPYFDSRKEFCLALKAARERKGITLDAIAASTKIPAYVFAGLERNDLRRWPKGLFRRSFFRDYVRAIGLPPVEACEEFVRLFPDDASRPPVAAGSAPEADHADEVRLVLDTAWHGPHEPVLARLGIAVMDAAVVLLVAAALAWVTGAGQATISAIVALTYFSLATVVFGGSPARRVLAARRAIFEALTPSPQDIATASHRGAEAISRVFDTPRFRVRIKVPQQH